MDEVLIIGSGPAGYTAAIYALRAGLKTSLIAGLQPGGQLTDTTDVDNWPGHANGVQGPELMEAMKKQVENLGCSIHADRIKAVDLSQPSFVAQGERKSYPAHCLIIASGASPRLLGLASEQNYFGKGVSTCATCDGFFYRNKKVAVIGGGNTALEESLYLANIAAQVALVHRRDQLRGDKILQQRLFQRAEEGKVQFHWNRVVTEILGEKTGVNGIRVKDTESDKEEDLAVDGVFIAIGHIPNSDFLPPQLAMENGYVKLKGLLGAGFTQTSVKGIFAAGDVADYHYRQAVTAAAMGCMAALDAKDYLISKGLA